MKTKDKKSELQESTKKVEKGKTHKYQNLLNARLKIGSAFVFTNPKIFQVKTHLND